MLLSPCSVVGSHFTQHLQPPPVLHPAGLHPAPDLRGDFYFRFCASRLLVTWAKPGSKQTSSFWVAVQRQTRGVTAKSLPSWKSAPYGHISVLKLPPAEELSVTFSCHIFRESNKCWTSKDDICPLLKCFIWYSWKPLTGLVTNLIRTLWSHEINHPQCWPG